MTTDQQPTQGHRHMYPPLPPLDEPHDEVLDPNRLPRRTKSGLMTNTREPLSIPSPTTCETCYIALDVGEAMFSPSVHTRDEAIQGLYEMMGFDGHDGYTGTIVIIEAVGSRATLLALDDINFGAAYLRLQSYRPSMSERRVGELAADIDESLRTD